MKEINTEKFDAAYEQFLTEKNPIIHWQSIQTILSEIDLADAFDELLEKEDGVDRFFLMWERAGKDKKNQKDKESLKKIGALSKKLHKSKSYKELCEFFFNLAFRHLAETIHLKERKDFEKLTDVDIYKKNLIPSEILLQFFLMETLIKRKDFDWNRGDEISKQCLACFIVCFGDTYEFFHEEG